MKKLLLIALVAFCEIANAQFTKIYDFTGNPNGQNPRGYFVSDGTYLYGMTKLGGAHNLGTVFKVMPDGSNYTDLLDFNGTGNGKTPLNSLFYDGTYLYGTTEQGGANGVGTIFKILPDGTGYVKLLDFAGTSNGEFPFGSLISDGTYLYGTTMLGGAHSDGTVFKIDTAGNNYTDLLDFANASNGAYPQCALYYDGTFLYGTTNLGGANSKGVVFKIQPDGNGYVKLLDFAGTSNGANPFGSLISDGTYLYGTTSAGGANSMGTVFKIDTAGNNYTDLLDFSGTANGDNPAGNLFYDGTFLYGMASQGGANSIGIIFKMSPDGSNFADLYDFSGTADGENPYGSLISQGNFFYGMTFAGGTNNDGTIFKYQRCTPPTVTILASATTVCAGDSVTLTGSGTDTYSWSGGVTDGVGFVPTTTTTYTVTGTDSVTTCSDTATATITVNNPTVSTQTVAACDSLVLNGQTYTTSGTFTQQINNQAGCDSTITLDLTINNPTTSAQTVTACDSLVLNGQTYTASGTFTQHLTNQAGCDSTISLDLTINNSTTSTQTVTACDSLVLNGQTYTVSGTFTQHLTNQAGCDSTISLDLTINNSTASAQTVTACDSLVLNGQTYTASGTFTQHLTNQAGCDSTISLDLTINNSTTSAQTVTACDSLVLNGQTYTASGTFTQHLTNQAGCDSTISLDLTINNSTASDQTVTACDSLVLNGQTYTASGTFTQHLTNQAGCDSTISLDLTINNSTTSAQTVTACDSLVLNGQTYTASGTFTQHLTNQAGCDSTITLDLTINNSTTSAQTVTACDSLVLNGQTYTASGTFTQHLTNQAGCDSTISLDLTINNSTTSAQTVTACDSLVLNGQTYTASGTFTQHLTNQAGCDSAITLNLTINPLPNISAGNDTTICSGAITTLCASGGLTYSWAPGGQTASCINVDSTGTATYTVTGTDSNSCSNISSVTVTVDICLGVSIIPSADNEISIYPNPTGGEMTISYFIPNSEKAAFTIYDPSGRKVNSYILIGDNNQLEISEKDLQDGIYFYTIISNGKKIKQGNIVLIK